MKKIVFIFALFLLLKPILPVVEYVVNYDYIATVLCENKDKPMMHCNGKCHLMKELAKNAEEDKPISSNKKVASQEHEVLFFQELKPFAIGYISAKIKLSSAPNYSNNYSYLENKTVFRPPIFI
jgi:hypothetical protein